MSRKKRIFIGVSTLILLLISVPITRFYRYAQHVRKNQELIEAIKAGNEQKALQLLAEGADGGARDTGKPVSMGALLLQLFGREPKQENGATHYAAIALLYEQAYGGRFPRHKPDPQLVKALMDHGAYLDEQDKEADTYLILGRRTVEPLYQRAEAAYPADSAWSEKLGILYLSDMYRETGDSRRKSALSSLAAYERALAHIQKEAAERALIVPEAAEAAFEAGQIDKARTYAEEMLKQEAQDRS